MNVRELRKALKKFPQDAMVVVDGYEGGIEEVSSIQEVDIRLNINSPSDWYYGRHEQIWGLNDRPENYPDDKIVKAIYLPR